MTKEELAALATQMQDALVRAASGIGVLDGTLLETEDLEGKWNKDWAPEYMAEAVKNINEYPEFMLACAGYAGMAAAKWWDEDWGRHHSEPFSALLGPRGFDDMDDHICQAVLGNPLDSTEAGVHRSTMECLSSTAWNLLNKSAVERGTGDALYAFANASAIMFRLGAAIMLKKLGYRYQAVNIHTKGYN